MHFPNQVFKFKFNQVNQFQLNLFFVDSNDSTHLTAIFQDNPDKPAPLCLHSGFYSN